MPWGSIGDRAKCSALWASSESRASKIPNPNNPTPNCSGDNSTKPAIPNPNAKTARMTATMRVVGRSWLDATKADMLRLTFNRERAEQRDNPHNARSGV
jgi:hypothetical protein